MSRMSCDLAIIGGGPSGMAAAVQGAALGLDTILFDEQPAPGGQIYRGIEAVQRERADDLRILGEDYEEGAGLVAAFRDSGAAYEPGSVVWQAVEDGRIGISHGGAARILIAQRILIATGAMERPVPIPRLDTARRDGSRCGADPAEGERNGAGYASRRCRCRTVALSGRHTVGARWRRRLPRCC